MQTGKLAGRSEAETEQVASGQESVKAQEPAVDAGAPNEEAAVSQEASPGQTDLEEPLLKKDLLVLLLLLGVQACCFLPICFKVGFYLDDWLTFWNLHFTRHDLIELIKASFADPRMVTRPIHCFYNAVAYFCFGDRPLGYHLLRFALEFAGTACLYLGLKRLSQSGFLAAVAALIFILYPSHDSTHYWLLGGIGPGCSLTLTLASFCFSIFAFTNKNKLLYGLSLAAYGLSAFLYESYLSLLVMSFCSILLLAAENRRQSRLDTIRSVIWWFLPFVALGALEPVYQRFILPRLTQQVHLSPSLIDPFNFCNVFVQGLNMSLFDGMWSFVAQRVREALLSFTPVYALQIAGVLAFAAGVLAVYKSDQSLRYRRLFTAGILTFFASYLPYAVAQGYTPVLDSIVNRVNTGASVAVAIISALSIKWLIDHMHLTGRSASLVATAICLPLVLIMVLADLGMSAFWIRSWEVQKDIRFLVSKHKDMIGEGDAILLAGTHRYLMWAPVFDGTWDFESMLRMTLDRKLISGGVVCDRLTFKDGVLQDISAGFVCARYPLSKITVLIPSKGLWVPIKSGSQFVELAAKNQRDFGLSPGTIERWRRELLSAGAPAQAAPN